MKKVLSVDGGGIRGILPARFIQALETAAGKPADKLFDLIAGTSTGGIIAVGLASGITAKALGDFYIQRGPAIFHSGLLGKADALTGSIYSAIPLETALKDILGNAWLSEIKDVEVLVPAYCLSIPDAFMFRTWRARAPNAAEDFLLRDVARCTSAAPIYFPKAVVQNMKGDTFEMVDGGVFANNPSDCAISAARELWPGEDVMVVSVGTGEHTAPINLGNGGLIDVGLKLPDVFMDASASMAGHQAMDAIGARYRRFEIDLATPLGNAGTTNTAMDDASIANLAKLELLAEKLIASADIAGLAKELLA